jgi:hypothetical protein
MRLDPTWIVTSRLWGGNRVGVEPNRQWVVMEDNLLSSAATKGIAGWMELITAMEEALTMTAGGENSCVVATPLLRHHFIQLE